MEHYDPKTIEERRAVAGQCQTALKYGIHTYIDEMDDAINQAYAAWPTRLYLIGLDGRVVYAGGLGPYDFKPKKLKSAMSSQFLWVPRVNPMCARSTNTFTLRVLKVVSFAWV